MIKESFIFDGQPDAKTFEKKQKSLFETEKRKEKKSAKKKTV